MLVPGVHLACGVDLAAADLDGDGGAQRGADGIGVSGRLPGMGLGLLVAVGGVAVEGAGGCLAGFGEAAIVPCTGSSVGESWSCGADWSTCCSVTGSR